jgi:hypothetical protein
MAKIFNILLETLGGRGLVQCEVNRLIKDVHNVIERKKYFTPSSLKQALENLGWEGHILDNHVLELVVLFLEGEGEFEIRRGTVH